MVQKNNATSTPEKIWFITGSSRGFGRIWAEAALERGDKVVATARDADSIMPLKEKYGSSVLTLSLDITNEEQVSTAVKTAFEYFGRLDVVVNNAGYSLVGTIEEASLNDIRALYETNVLGTVSVIQAVLPYLRKQRSGHILGVSSSLGHIAQPLIGYYCSSKWAFEAIHESLALELQPFDIKVTIIEPGAYRTEFGSQQSLHMSSAQPQYAPLREKVFDHLKNKDQGNPALTPGAIFKVVDVQHPPLRLNLGKYNLPEVKKIYQQRINEWEAWAEIANSVQ